MVDTNNHMYHNIFKLPLETVILVVDGFFYGTNGFLLFVKLYLKSMHPLNC